MGSIEQRMEKASYAVLTLFYAVPQTAQETPNPRNGLCVRELHGFIRRSQWRTFEFTLLITLFSRKQL